MAGLARLSRDARGADFARQVAVSPDTAPLSPRERALVAYAVKVNDAPATVTEGDLAPMRALGVTDAEILHANLVVGYFAFANRLTLGLGVEIEPEPETLGG